ncbi:MAG: hypothetical protein O9284_01660 [Steroidobacteraceae bacterium]|jgi:hypothetical protein|nr:hypothetical protein [Steroidobacteraceae bacterium]
MHSTSRFERSFGSRLTFARALALLALATVVALAGCGGEGPEARRTQIEIAVDVPPGSPADRHWQTYVGNVKLWAPEFVVARVPRPPGGLQALGQDRVQVMHFSSAEIGRAIPELAVLDRPLLFTSAQEADHVLDRVIKDEVGRRLAARGYSFVGWTEGEPRVAYPSTDPAAAPRIATLAAHETDPAAGPAVLLDAGLAPGLIVAAPAWFEPLSPHDADVFRLAYALPDARADTRRVAAEAVARLQADPQRAVRAPTPEEVTALRAAVPPPTDPAAVELLRQIEAGRAEFATAPR